MTRIMLVILLSGAPGPAPVQQPVEKPVEKPAQPPAQAAEPPPAAPAYTYRPEGRRDPFVSLVGRGSEASADRRAPGLPGMLINEVNLKGIMKERSGFIAMVQGPDRKTYVVRPGQRLLDGTVKAITADTVVFSQDVNDPLSLVKQREVRKTLRSGGENRG